MNHKKIIILSSILLLTACNNAQGKEKKPLSSTENTSIQSGEKSTNEPEEKIESNSKPEDYIIDPLLLVNKENSLNEDYVPANLAIPNVPKLSEGTIEKNYVSSEIIPSLEKLFEDAASLGLHFKYVSGYRSYDRQEQLYNTYINQFGQEHTEKYSALPGQSEHQTGLSLDVSSPSANNSLEEYFADTEEGKWLAENCYKYGFIIRYLKGKEDITGYAYEPWHIRFVGKEAAEEIHTNQLTLEEYLNKNQ